MTYTFIYESLLEWIFPKKTQCSTSWRKRSRKNFYLWKEIENRRFPTGEHVPGS